ncbi:unnamed protein product [Amoebophrya sp. A120]|nr:unnamed protein product [Amoebophrya sp. A120]|eukprot:GSA120T00008316001.1
MRVVLDRRANPCAKAMLWRCDKSRPLRVALLATAAGTQLAFLFPRLANAQDHVGGAPLPSSATLPVSENGAVDEPLVPSDDPDRLPPASNKLLQSYYTFGADRFACDGQCMYCSSSHAHARWSRIREVLTTYKERHDRAVATHDYSFAQAWHFELQELLDWSWDRHKFECIPGIINLRLASYGYTSLQQFTEPTDDVMDWLIQFNAHTGALDLLQSAWPQLLQGGWPIFMLLDEVSRKIRGFLNPKDEQEKEKAAESYPKLWRKSFCDAEDAGTPFVEEYWSLLRNLLDRGTNLELGHHMGLVLKRPKCDVGLATALLGVASELINQHEIYMSSMEELHNVIFVLVTAAQDSVISYTKKDRSDISLWFDLLLTKWPIWKMLDRLSCKSSSQTCVVRSEVRCYSPKTRSYLDCHSVYDRPSWKPNYALCGEHDTCTLLNGTNNLNFSYYDTVSCVDWRQPRVGHEFKPFLRKLTHDDELRVCSQCGQDGVLRTIFKNIRFTKTPVVERDLLFELLKNVTVSLNESAAAEVLSTGVNYNPYPTQGLQISGLNGTTSPTPAKGRAAVQNGEQQDTRLSSTSKTDDTTPKMLSSLEAPQTSIFGEEEDQLQSVATELLTAENHIYEQPFFIEFGARKPHMLNSAWLREHCGWKGLLMDFQPGGTKHGGCGEGCVGKDLVENEFITAENVNDVFRKYRVPREPDLLTIDIDFNDYWVWKAILEKKEFFPRVVAVDYNADLDLEDTKAVYYDAKGEWDGTRYTTASLHAYYLLAQKHGYEYAYNLEMGSHAFFIRRDLLHESDHNLPIRAVRKLSHKADYSKRPFLDTLFSSIGNGRLNK